MMKKNGIIDKELVDLANSAEKMFEKKKAIANSAIDNLPESESKKKAQLKKLMKSANPTNVNPTDLVNELNKIVNGG